MPYENLDAAGAIAWHLSDGKLSPPQPMTTPQL